MAQVPEIGLSGRRTGRFKWELRFPLGPQFPLSKKSQENGVLAVLIPATGSRYTPPKWELAQREVVGLEVLEVGGASAGMEHSKLISSTG